MSEHRTLSDDEHARWRGDRGFAELRQVLFWRWDPLGADAHFPDSEDEYDAYLDVLLSRLRAAATPNDIAEHLRGIEIDEMGLTAVNHTRLREVSQFIHHWYGSSVARWADADEHSIQAGRETNAEMTGPGLGVLWQPSWGTYHRWHDSRPVVVTVDQAAVEYAGQAHPYCCRVDIRMARPREDGLRDPAESDALVAVEDAIDRALGRLSDPWLVGSLIHAGMTTLVYYLPDDLPAASAAILASDGYVPDLTVVRDEDWRFFRDHLEPNELQKHLITSAVEQAARQQHGDAIQAERDVDHFILAPDPRVAEGLAQSLRSRGYRVSTHGGVGAVPIQATRRHSIDRRTLEAVIGEILDIAEPVGGRYDGWGAPIVAVKQRFGLRRRLGHRGV